MIADILLTFLLTGCLPVEGEKVVARDLTGASAVFAALPADAAFGYAPAPGAQRLLNATELKRLAWPQDLALDPGLQLCVVRPLEPLSGERLVEAMRSALARPEARIELVEMAAFGAPRGQIEFPPAGLRRPPPASPGQPVLWQGFVRYAERRRYPIWAKVRILVSSTRVVAGQNLVAGEAIESGQLRLESVEGFPSSEPLAESLEQVVGRAPTRPVAAGTTLSLKMLGLPKEVQRGDPVKVEASHGSATVGITGRAESSGARGDMVVVRNPTSGKSFRARVEGKGKVVVGASGGGEP